MERILLRGGNIISGTGTQAFKGNILIEGDIIKEVIDRDDAVSDEIKVLDISEYTVTPGFIDVHSHSDCLLPLENHEELLACLLEQGITTIIGGNCGISPAPVAAETIDLMNNVVWTGMQLEYNWRSMGEFLERIEKIKPVVNLAQLVGHTTVRISEVGMSLGALTTDQFNRCINKVRRSLDEGACGLSFGLGYDPARCSTNEEIEKFSKVSAKVKKPIAVHLKAYSKQSAEYASNVGPHNIHALKEMIDVARTTRAALQVSHFMLLFKSTWPLIDDCIKEIQDAHRGGVDINMDAFPYIHGYGVAPSLLPVWFLRRLPNAYKNRFLRTLVRFEHWLGRRQYGYSLGRCRLLDAAVEDWKNLDGLTFQEIAHRWKTSPTKAILRLSEASKGQAAILIPEFAGDAENEEPVETILSHDLCLFGTDVLIRKSKYPNPGALGSFPKILGRYVRERKLFSLENAISRMTYESAARFGLKNRGVLDKGKAADLVVFDPETISEIPPSGGKPAGRPLGIYHVFLNGKHVVEEGLYTGKARAGKVIRI